MSASRTPRFDRMEWAGAFGDLGTLIPFLIAYISVAKVPAFGVLLSFGIALVAVGLYYRTPFPVQPMKASGAVAATQAAQLSLTAQTIYCASILSGLIWLFLGMTGLAKWISAWVPRCTVVGIVLGLGLSFMVRGIEMMSTGWIIGGIALAGTLILLTNRVIPAMFVVLIFGILVALNEQPELFKQLAEMRLEWTLPTWTWGETSLRDWISALIFLTLPQVPLTLGNAIIAITEENNRLFPHRPTSEREVACSTGVVNLMSGALGGVPLCHGAGGMAAQVRFGARTGGAPIILGVLLIVLALSASDSFELLLRLFPIPVLGTILFLTGVQLALGSCDFSRDKGERFVTLGTAAISMWNVGVGFAFGLAAYYMVKRGWIKL